MSGGWKLPRDNKDNKCHVDALIPTPRKHRQTIVHNKLLCNTDPLHALVYCLLVDCCPKMTPSILDISNVS